MLPIAAPRRLTLPQRARLGCTQPTSAGVGMTRHERRLHVAGPGRVCISRLISRSMQLLYCLCKPIGQPGRPIPGPMTSRIAHALHSGLVRAFQQRRLTLLPLWALALLGYWLGKLWARWKHRQERRTPLLQPEAPGGGAAAHRPRSRPPYSCPAAPRLHPSVRLWFLLRCSLSSRVHACSA